MNIIGMWMWPGSIRIHGARQVVAQCARARVSDIFFLTKGLAGTTSYRSNIVPNSDARDLLRELLDEAHQRGVRVHAWFTSASDELYKQQHPESGRYHFRNGRDKGLISLADEGYLAYMTQIIREVCSRYDIDGIHLDYIRYNHLLYGWSEDDLARYAAEGADPAYLRQLMERMFYGTPDKEENLLFDAYHSGDASVHALARARRKDVVHFASTLVNVAREARPGLIISAALMPEGAYDDLAFSDLHYGQNYEDAARLYDYALPMAYSKAYDQGPQWVRNVAEGTNRRGLKTIVGLHAYEGGTGPSLQADIASLQDAPILGYCLFREGATALAFSSGATLTVWNPLSQTITRVVAGHAGTTTCWDEAIAPGAEKTFPLPAAADEVRVFCGEKEGSVYLTAEK